MTPACSFTGGGGGEAGRGGDDTAAMGRFA